MEFVFNPNFKEFRKKLKYGTSEKPMIFVYSPPLYMSRYIGEFKESLGKWTEVFDIYYTGDESEASQLFYTKEFPEIFPYVAIIDSKKRKELKGIPIKGNKEDKQPGISLQKDSAYYHKYREIIFFNKIEKDLNKLVDKYLDGELHHFY